jgi:ATP-dependent Clp protease protease subunit
MKTEPIVLTQMALNGLALGFDVEQRTIYLNGPIDSMSTYRFISGFKFLDRQKGAIHVVVNSPGGNLDDGFAIYDCIRTANNPTVCEGIGAIASAAVPVFEAGTVRFLNPETRIMVHNLSYEMDGSVGTPVMLSLGKETERSNKRYHEILAARTGRSVKDIERWCQDETFFTANEAIKNGFADKILDGRPLPKNFDEGMAEVQAVWGHNHFTEATPRKRKKAKKTVKRGKGKK